MIATNDLAQMFLEFLKTNGHPLDGQINYDSSKFHYLKCPHGSKTDARYKLFMDGIASGYFKCWHCNIEAVFCSKQKNEVCKETWKKHQERISEVKENEEIETKKRHEKVAVIAQDIYSKSSENEAETHDYLNLKKIKNHGLRVVKEENAHTRDAKCYKGTLLVPCSDIDGNLVNLERIYFDNKQNKYQKRSLKDGKRTGTFYLIGEINSSQETILIAEGIATASTAFEATQLPTVAAFSCNNIKYVAQALKKKYPSNNLLIVVDDDKNNAGLEAAEQACIELDNVSYILPDFSILNQTREKVDELKLSDINDVYVHLLLEGKNEEEALNMIHEQIVHSTSNLQSMPHMSILKKLLKKVGKVDFRRLAELQGEEKLKDSQIQVICIEEILQLAKHNKWGLCKKHDFVYLYNGEYWSLLEDDDLKSFLGDAARKMGLKKVHSQHYNFKDNLLKQFKAAAYLPTPNHPSDTININLKNCTFEVNCKGNKLKSFSHNDFMTYQLPFEYDPEAKAPIFEAYLNRVLPDLQLQQIMAEYLGYVFIRTSTLKLEKTLLLYGSGANGKSVFYEVVRNLFGENNTSEFSLQSLTNENGYYRAMIANKLVNYASEINGKLEASTFKQLVSGEPVEARLPYGKPFIVREYAKFIFNCNELPKDVEQTNAFFRRFLIIPFEQAIPENEQDKQLAKKIISSELSGVFNWVLEGLERLLMKKQFTESNAVKNAREKYEKESDTVKLFLEEYGYAASSMRYTPLKTLYNEYRAFCMEDGFHPVNKTKFKDRLEKCNIVIERKSVGKVVFVTMQE